MDANDQLFESMRSCEGLDIAVVPDGSIVDASWCLRLLRAIRDVSFATIDGTGLPSVRILKGAKRFGDKPVGVAVASCAAIDRHYFHLLPNLARRLIRTALRRGRARR